MAKFGITGEYITDIARGLWYDKKYSDALEYLDESVFGMTQDQKIQLIEYKMKLVGVNEFDFVEDDEEKPDDYPTFKIMLENAQSGCCGEFYDKEYDKQYEQGLRIIRLFENYQGHYVELEDGELDYKGRPTKLQRVVTYDKEFGYQFQGFSTKIKKNEYHLAIDEWFDLLPEVKHDLKDQIPFYMSVWMREHSGFINPAIVVKMDGHEGINPMLIPGYENYVHGAGFGIMSSKSIAYNVMPPEAWEDINAFRRVCDKYFIYDEDRDEIWENYNRLINSIKIEVLKEEEEKRQAPFKKELNERFDNYELEQEENNIELKIDNSMKSSVYAWVDRNGNYYPSPYIKHDDIAELIVEKLGYLENINNKNKSAVHILEDAGWLRIHTYGKEGCEITFSHIKNLSEYQKNRIRSYCNYYNINYPEYIDLD